MNNSRILDVLITDVSVQWSRSHKHLLLKIELSALDEEHKDKLYCWHVLPDEGYSFSTKRLMIQALKASLEAVNFTFKKVKEMLSKIDSIKGRYCKAKVVTELYDGYTFVAVKRLIKGGD